MEHVLSQKKVNQLSFNGFLYTKDKSLKLGKVAWKCVEYNKYKCRGRLHLRGDAIIWQSGNHNHEQRPNEIAARKVLAEMKQKGAESIEEPANIVDNATTGLSSSVASKLPAIQSMKRTIQRARAAASGSLNTLRNNTATDIENTSAADDDNNDYGDAASPLDVPCVQTLSSASQLVQPSAKSRAKRSENKNVENQEQVAINRCMCARASVAERDQYVIFGEYVADELRSLGREEDLQFKMKTSIQRIIFEINSEYATRKFSNNSSC